MTKIEEFELITNEYLDNIAKKQISEMGQTTITNVQKMLAQEIGMTPEDGYSIYEILTFVKKHKIESKNLDDFFNFLKKITNFES